jgi:hypothetical protein
MHTTIDFHRGRLMKMIKVSGNFKLPPSPDSDETFSLGENQIFIIEKRDVPFQIKNFSFPLTSGLSEKQFNFFSPSRLPRRVARLAMFQKIAL